MTLVEVLVALTIAAGGLGAILVALTQAQRIELAIERVDVETELAQSLLEEAYVNALPVEAWAPLEDLPGVQRWVGVANGVEWEVTVSTSAMRSLVDERSRSESLEDRRRPPVLLAMDVITCRAGGTTLRTVRW